MIVVALVALAAVSYEIWRTARADEADPLAAIERLALERFSQP